MTPAAGGDVQANEHHHRKLERMYVRAAVNRYFQPTLHVGEGSAVVTIPVRPEFFHAAGAIHGSIYFKALDDAAFFAANSLVSEVFVLTVSFTVYLVRPVSEGVLTAKGTVVHRSRNLYVAESVASDSNDREVARGSGTFMRSQVPLSPDIGYE